jgi:hypothetical protein
MGGVAAAFRLRNILKSHVRETQAEACGYQNMYCDTVSKAGIQNQSKLLDSRTRALQGIRESDKLGIIRGAHNHKFKKLYHEDLSHSSF